MGNEHRQSAVALSRQWATHKIWEKLGKTLENWGKLGNPGILRLRTRDFVKSAESFESFGEDLIGIRLLRLARRSDLGLGRRSSVFKGSGIAEISAMQGVAPPEAERRVSLEIDFSGLRGGAISALAVAQVYLGGHETPIRARKGSGIA